MKILVLATTYPRWAHDHEPSFVHSLSKGLTAKGHDVFALVPHTVGAKRQEMLDGVSVLRFRYLPQKWQRLAYDGGIVPKLKKSPLLALQIPFLFGFMLVNAIAVTKKYKIDLVHAHWLIPQGLIAVLLKRFFRDNLKVISTSHGADLYSLKHPLLISLKRAVIKRSNAVTVVSSAMKNFCDDLMPDARNICVQSMGVDVGDVFSERTSFEQRNGFIFVGRLTEKKGCDDLLRAFSLLQKNHPGQILKVIGDGLDARSLHDLAKELKLEGSVDFLGALPAKEVAYELNSAKYSIMPSKIATSGDQEGLGLVAVESLSCGCITIVSDLPAIKDVHDCEVLQFESGNVHSLYERMVYVLENEQRCKELSTGLKERAKKRFSWSTVCANYDRLILSLFQ